MKNKLINAMKSLKTKHLSPLKKYNCVSYRKSYIRLVIGEGLSKQLEISVVISVRRVGRRENTIYARTSILHGAPDLRYIEYVVESAVLYMESLISEEENTYNPQMLQAALSKDLPINSGKVEKKTKI